MRSHLHQFVVVWRHGTYSRAVVRLPGTGHVGSCRKGAFGRLEGFASGPWLVTAPAQLCWGLLLVHELMQPEGFRCRQP